MVEIFVVLVVVRVSCVRTNSLRLSCSMNFYIQSEFLATDPEVPGSIPGATRFFRSSGCGTGSTQPREYN
jgi:hypothetical protein